MAHYDYFVATVPMSSEVEAVYPVLLSQVAGGKLTSLHGYRLTIKERVGVGINGDGSRLMVIGTGASAEVAAGMLMDIRGVTPSIARLDIQETVAVDNADRVIQFLSPRKVYKASRWSAVGAPGETLYVGSPSSDARLRVYNKSAEAGISPGDGKDYLRIEVQLRNRYADRAYKEGEAGRAPVVLAHWIRRMLSERDAEYLLHLMEYHSVGELIRIQEDEEDAMARRKLWIERSVVPALKKVLVQEPEYLEVVLGLLLGVEDKGGDRYNVPNCAATMEED